MIPVPMMTSSIGLSITNNYIGNTTHSLDCVSSAIHVYVWRIIYGSIIIMVTNLLNHLKLCVFKFVII